ncbi:MAG: hypothetical protein ACP5HZ_00605 [Ferrimicrobium sp.]|uniref:hypothetical protein n=2 Tax=Ferrimicrobium sp. TaxID=2926050 RepID=UPI002617938E|nr:hypothetical protein [Ferrimicrobium sp.]
MEAQGERGSEMGDVSRIGRRSAIGLAVQLLAITALAVITSVPAFGAPPTNKTGGHKTTPTGYDISYPQCGESFPSNGAFGIVGINDGLANNLNPCLAPDPSYSQSELYWAYATTSGDTSQPKVSLYVDTADPGNLYDGDPVADWPTSGTTPYGTCTTMGGASTIGEDSSACAYQYGFNKASQDASWLTKAASAIDSQSPSDPMSTVPGSYVWWLDVETSNTWQSGSSGLTMNVADLQGMIAALEANGVSAGGVGVYSTSSQWSTVVGVTTAASGSLWQLPDWIPGARTLTGAIANCALPSFTGGVVSVTQWTARSDGDYAC